MFPQILMINAYLIQNLLNLLNVYLFTFMHVAHILQHFTILLSHVQININTNYCKHRGVYIVLLIPVAL